MKSFNDLIPTGATEIWYCKPSRGQFDNYDMKKKFGTLPDKDDLTKTHVLLGRIAKTDLDEVFALMQGENWSPNGEARKLIESKGLQHTSMSTGDIIKIDNVAYFIDWVGFIPL